MMLDDFEVGVGVEPAKARRHQGHHVDVLGLDPEEIRPRLGTKRFRRASVARARRNAQQKNALKARHLDRFIAAKQSRAQGEE